RSTHGDEREVKGEVRELRNDTDVPFRTIAKIGRDRQRALTADAHAGHSLIPSRNDFASAEAEGERIVAIARAVELPAFMIRASLVVEPAGVVDLHAPPGRRFRAGTHLD